MSTFEPQFYHLKFEEKVQVRSARPGDGARLVQIYEDVIAEGKYTLAAPDEFTRTEASERASITRYAERPGRVYLVAVVGGDVVGLLEFSNGSYKSTAHSGMLSMFVDQAWRGRGIGTALLEALLAWAEAEPIIEKVTLAVFANNPRAITLYKKMGFLVEGQCPKDMKFGPDEYVDSVLMYRFVT